METIALRIEEVGEYLGLEEGDLDQMNPSQKLERILGVFLAREEEFERRYQEVAGEDGNQERDHQNQRELEVKKIQ